MYSIHHFVQFLDALDPIVFNGVRQAAEDVVAILHSARENLVDLFILGLVIDEIEHIHRAARLPKRLIRPSRCSRRDGFQGRSTLMSVPSV